MEHSSFKAGGSLPRHIAIIMDGNGRWAKARNLPRAAGHAAGAETFRRIATYCRDIGIGCLTVYAFSTENWKRPKDEVGAIMKLLEQYLVEALETMERDRLRIFFFGNTAGLSQNLQNLIAETEAKSQKLDGCRVNICLNYGGRDEILRAARLYAENAVYGEELTEEVFEKYLYSAGLPDPDLVIRPSGEFRLSNFMLWQLAYTELYFAEKYWPDFTSADIDAALEAYYGRNRRYGDIV